MASCGSGHTDTPGVRAALRAHLGPALGRAGCTAADLHARTEPGRPLLRPAGQPPWLRPAPGRGDPPADGERASARPPAPTGGPRTPATLQGWPARWEGGNVTWRDGRSVPSSP